MSQAITNKILGQSRDNDTSVHQVYTPPDNRIAKINKIFLANTSSSSVKVRVFISTGTTRDQTTAVLYDVPIGGLTTVEVDGGDEGYGLEFGDEIAYQQDTANAITITVFGREYGEQI